MAYLHGEQRQSQANCATAKPEYEFPSHENERYPGLCSTCLLRSRWGLVGAAAKPCNHAEARDRNYENPHLSIMGLQLLCESHFIPVKSLEGPSRRRKLIERLQAFESNLQVAKAEEQRYCSSVMSLIPFPDILIGVAR